MKFSCWKDIRSPQVDPYAGSPKINSVSQSTLNKDVKLSWTESDGGISINKDDHESLIRALLISNSSGIENSRMIDGVNLLFKEKISTKAADLT